MHDISDDSGHDFRPSYRGLGKLHDLCPKFTPIVALTATATLGVQSDIINNLGLTDPLVVRSTVNRPNLKYLVMSRNSINDVASVMLTYFRKFKAENALNRINFPTLVYVNTKKDCEDVCNLLKSSVILQREGLTVAYYHAGLSLSERKSIQLSFQRDEIQVIVATVAFGMGINKPDIRLIINYGMPKSLEAYSQETGRAGRDGLLSYCVLLYNRNDHIKLLSSQTFNRTASINSSSQSNFEKQLQLINHYCVTNINSIEGIENSTRNGVYYNSSNTDNSCSEKSSTVVIPEYAEYTSKLSCSFITDSCRNAYMDPMYHQSIQSTETHMNCRRNLLLRYFNDEESLHALPKLPRQSCCDLCDQYLASARIFNCQEVVMNYESKLPFQILKDNQCQLSVNLGYEITLLLTTVIKCGEYYGLGVPLSILLGIRLVYNHHIPD